MEELAEVKEIDTKVLPKLGYLGVGWIGKNRLEALNQSNLAESIAIYDLHEPNVWETLKVVPQAKAHLSYENILQENIDGVVIATPSAQHAEQTIQALESGKAVFCQKPLGRNLAETKAVVEKAEQMNKLLGVDYSYKHTKGIKALKEILEKKQLGKIYAVEAVFHNAYGPDKEWFYDRKQSGGGCLMDLGSHLVDLLIYLFDNPEMEVKYSNILSAGKKLPKDERTVEDFAEAQLLTSNNISIRLACSWKLSVGKDADIFLKIYGSEGGASFHNVNGSFFDFQLDVFNQNSSDTLVSPPDDWGGKAIQDWAKKLACENAYCSSNESLIKSAEILENIYKKAQS